MATNFMRIRNGISLGNLPSAPSNPLNGDFYYDTTLNSFQFYQNGSWQTLQTTSTINGLVTDNDSAGSVTVNSGTSLFNPYLNIQSGNTYLVSNSAQLISVGNLTIAGSLQTDSGAIIKVL